MRRFPFSGEPVYKGHLGRVNLLAFSPDGRLFATSGSEDGTVRVWNTQSGRQIHLLHVSSNDSFSGLECLAFSADGNRLHAYDSGDGELRTWEVQSGRLIRQEGRRWTRGMISSRGKWIATSKLHGEQQSVRIRDLESGKLQETLIGPHTEFVYCFGAIGFSEDEGIVIVGDDNETQVLDLITGERVPAAFDRDARCTRLNGFGAIDGRQVVLQAAGNELQALDLRSGKAIRTVRLVLGRMRGVHGTALSPKRPWAAVLQYGTGVTVLDLDTGHRLADYPQESPWYTSVAFSPTGRYLVIGSDDGSLEVYKTADWQLHYRLAGAPTEISTLDVEPRSRYLIAVQKDGQGFVWDLRSLTLFRPTPGRMERVYSVSDPSGPAIDLPGGERLEYFLSYRALTTPVADQTVDPRIARASLARQKYEATTKSEPPNHGDGTTFRYSITSAEASVTGVVDPKDLGILELLLSGGKWTGRYWKLMMLSPNGRWLALADPGLLVLIDVHKGKSQEISFDSEEFDPISASVSDEGRKVALGFNFGTGKVLLFDFKTRRITTPLNSGDTTTAVALSPDGNSVAGGDAYNRWVKVTTLGRQRKRKTLDGHAHGIRSLVYTPDGKTLISSAGDGQIILWDAVTLERKATLMVFTHPELANPLPDWIAFTPDGRWNGSKGVSRKFTTFTA